MNKPASIEAWLAELGRPAADRDYLPGHARMQALLDAQDLRRPALRIRIAGTNGKGSTAHLLARSLSASGLRVGLYTSPHILAFNERIRVNGEAIDDGSLQHHMARLMPVARACGASYFEMATAIALAHFSECRVDVEILEAGVGARLDATTAVVADMALITPVALDHQAWLGDTLADIACEKAHATDGCSLALSAPQEPEVGDILRQHCPHIRFAYPYDGPLKLTGEHQRINAGLAWLACHSIGGQGLLPVDIDAARRALAATELAGRMQRIDIGAARVWLDAAHNLHAIRALLPSLKRLADPFDAIVVWTREDRSLAGAPALLAPFAGSVLSNDDETHRLPATPWQCLRHLIAERPDGRFLLLGSFTTVASVLEQLDH